MTNSIDHHDHVETHKLGLWSSSAASVEFPGKDFTTMREWLDGCDQPFKVFTPPLLEKRKRNGVKPQIQNGLFEEGLAVQYEVQPRAAWKSLRRYKKFSVMGSGMFATGDFILVRHDGTDGSAEDSSSDWKAKVLEVRALDPQHVYIRVSWLNRPEDMAGGRQDFHGEKELVPTNQMDIIDAMSVNGKFCLKHWDEIRDIGQDDTSETDVYYWRETCDFTGQRFSKKAMGRQCGIGNPPRYPHRRGRAVTRGGVGNKGKQNIGPIQETSIPHAKRSSGRSSARSKA